MFDFSNRYNATVYLSCALTLVMRHNKYTNNINALIVESEESLNFHLEDYIAKQLLSEYELYSKGSSFYDLMTKSWDDWSNQLKVFFGIYYQGNINQISAYDSAGNVKFDKRWFTNNGEYKYPPNNGIKKGSQKYIELNTGELIDRYGYPSGKYASPVGVSFEERALGPDTSPSNYHCYKVIKPITVESSIVEPWYEWKGGGLQYRFEKSISYLVKEGYLIEVQ